MGIRAVSDNKNDGSQSTYLLVGRKLKEQIVATPNDGYNYIDLRRNRCAGHEIPWRPCDPERRLALSRPSKVTQEFRPIDLPPSLNNAESVRRPVTHFRDE